MRKNSEIAIYCQKVILVPYQEIHVPKYHEWMQSQELQQLTASEPLTLEQEFQMQKSWMADDDKCTFIILDAATYSLTGDEVQSMIGDTNLFINDCDNPRQAEIEIMIAETCHRRHGFGKEAIQCMLRYGIEDLGITSYVAKIGAQNLGSIHLFQQLGFVEVSQNKVFGEVQFEKPLTHEWHQWLMEHTKVFKKRRL